MNHNKPQSPRQPLRPDTYLRTIYARPEYQDTLARGNFSVASDDERQRLRHEALGRAANFLVRQNTTPNQYVTPEGSVYKMVSQLGSFYHSQTELNRFETLDHPTDRATIRAHKERVINFNHSLRDVIDKHPDMEAQELVRFMGSSYERLYGSEKIEDFLYKARMCVTGMQHEVLAEQIIGAIDDDNLTYDETDLEGEMKGADLYITLNDFTFPVDIKATPHAVERSIEKIGKGNQLWSGVPQSAIGGRFRLTREEASRYAPDMRDRLYAMAQRRSPHQQNRSIS